VKIIRLTVWQRDLPLSEPYWLSGGRLKFETLDSTFLRIDTDEGLTGWGEGCPWGHTYLPAHGPGLRAGLQTLAPALLGLDPRQTGIVERRMDLELPGHLYAKAPIDLACWDIAGQAAGLSLADMLGGRYDDPTSIASSISTDTPQGMLDSVKSYRAKGYRVHSVKIGAEPTRDITRIRLLEQDRLADERILYDVNRAWTRREAMIVMNAVADLGVTIEQPGETLDDIAAIRAQTTCPISVDERLNTLQDMARIARDGLAEVVNIKINRVGGPSKAARIRDLAIAHGIQCYVMATGGSAIADTEAAHVAQTIPPEYRLGTWSCQDMLSLDVTDGRGCRNQNGHLRVDTGPGLGIAPDLDQLGDPVAIYEA